MVLEEEPMRYIATYARAGGLLLVMLATSSANGQPPEAKTGLRVGTNAPAFTLKDQNGKERTLDEFLKKGKVALVFYRSASW
jgi:cytochrome oxidase Cu insertion factor (SCO1/SenC/PrrC family)